MSTTYNRIADLKTLDQGRNMWVRCLLAGVLLVPILDGALASSASSGSKAAETATKPVLTIGAERTRIRTTSPYHVSQWQASAPVIGNLRREVADSLELGDGVRPRFSGFAECADRPVAIDGDLIAGEIRTLELVLSGTGRRAIAVINGEPVYVPDLEQGDGTRLIMPKIKEIYFRYPRVLRAAEANTMRNGWFSKARALSVSRGEVIKDHRDGTVQVRLPRAPDALFPQTVQLVVVTDRCTLRAPIEIKPAMHMGRWFPPALVTQCFNRHNPVTTFAESGDLTTNTRFDSTVRGTRPLTDATQPYARYHNCSPYGAIHEGGRADGAAHAGGEDTYLFWDGGFSSHFTVKALSNCVVEVKRYHHDGTDIGTARAGEAIARHASRKTLEVRVKWKIEADHGYCWYALVAQGRHPVSLPEQWSTRFGPNHLGSKSSLVHLQDKSQLHYLKRLPSGHGQPNTSTYEIEGSE